MNKAPCFALAVFALAACQQEPATPVASAPAPACALKMGLDPYEPYQFTDMDGAVRGLDVELVNAMANEAGCSLRFVQKDWTALLAGVKSGEIDLLAGASRNADREQFAQFSEPYREEVFALFVRTGEAEKWQGALEDLVRAQGMRVGITDGYLYSDSVNGLADDPAHTGQFVTSAMSEVHIGNLLDQKVDGVLEDPFVVAAILRRKNMAESVQRSPLAFESKPVHLMFSKQSVAPETIAKLEAARQKLQQDGRFQGIVNRYLK